MNGVNIENWDSKGSTLTKIAKLANAYDGHFAFYELNKKKWKCFFSCWDCKGYPFAKVAKWTNDSDGHFPSLLENEERIK